MIAFGINSAVPGSEIKVLHELLVHPWRWVALLVLAIELILAAVRPWHRRSCASSSTSA